MGVAFGVEVDKAQRSHAITRNAYLLIVDEDAPAAIVLDENGDELAAVVDVLMLTRAHAATL
jgi:hypothetical protein